MTENLITLDQLNTRIGEVVGTSRWFMIHQPRIDRFADATEDHQWLHVNTERANKESPFGSTIAHGLLTLSLIPAFFDSALCVLETRMGVNYGLNRVRFTAPVPVGSRLRARLTLLSSEPIEQNGFQMVWSVSVEREGAAKPVCVAESIARRYP
jgi:acyl dehydratase